MVARVVSGGQTGVDRAALDVARELGIPCGGWVPRGRWAEDGAVPDCYPNMVETASTEPIERTRRNVRDSDATLVIVRGALVGGTAETLAAASELGKPVRLIDLDARDEDAAVIAVAGWLRAEGPATLNVAGPRASEDAEIYELARRVLTRALSEHGVK